MTDINIQSLIVELRLRIADLERRLRIAEAQVKAAERWSFSSQGNSDLIEWMDRAKADAEKETA